MFDSGCQLCAEVSRNGRKDIRCLPLHLLSCESWIFVRKKRDRKKTKTKKANYALQHVRADSRCMWMKRVLNLLWRRSLLYRNQFIDLQNRSVDWDLYDKNLRHESVNALLLAWIHWDIFLDYDKIIDIYAFKYQRRMLLISPLSKN